MNELRISRVSFAGECMTTEFSNGHSVAVPVSAFPRLQSASAADRERWELIGRGLGVHWPACDEDLSVENILLAYSRSKSAEYARAAKA